METGADFIFLGSKITAVNSYCSHEIKRRLLLERKAMTNLDSILKSGDIALLTKVPIVKAMVFLIVMYGCENWTIKKAECQRTDAFKLCWRRLLRIPWTTRRSNQSLLKKSTLNIHWKADAEAETPILWPSDAGKDWGQEEKRATEDEMAVWHHCLNVHEFEQTLGDSEGQGSLACCSPWGHKESETT